MPFCYLFFDWVRKVFSKWRQVGQFPRKAMLKHILESQRLISWYFSLNISNITERSFHWIGISIICCHFLAISMIGIVLWQLFKIWHEKHVFVNKSFKTLNYLIFVPKHSNDGPVYVRRIGYLIDPGSLMIIVPRV